MKAVSKSNRRRPAPRTATKAYIENFTAVDDLLTEIRRKILDGPDCREATWCNVGDLAHVRELLQQAADFLRKDQQ